MTAYFLTDKALQMVFAEWERRYRDNPEAFVLIDESKDYSTAAARTFAEIFRDLHPPKDERV